MAVFAVHIVGHVGGRQNLSVQLFLVVFLLHSL